MGWLPDSAQHALMDRLRVPFTGAVNILSIVFGVIGTCAALYVGTLPNEQKADAANLLLIVLVLFLVVWVMGREFHLARKQKYANASHSVYHLTSKFRELNEYLLECLASAQQGKVVSIKDVQKRFSDSLQDVCDETVRLFSMVTGTNCRAAVKVPAFDSGDESICWAETIARDTNSAMSNKQLDAMRARDRVDLIVDNEDFFILFDDATPDIGYYIHNNLPKRFKSGELKTTSVRVYKDAAAAGGRRMKEGQYPLPYRSTMVWPIRSGDTETIPRFHAFFAVDSESRRVFYETWDSKIGGSIAEQATVSFRIFNELLDTMSDNGT